MRKCRVYNKRQIHDKEAEKEIKDFHDFKENRKRKQGSIHTCTQCIWTHTLAVASTCHDVQQVKYNIFD